MNRVTLFDQAAVSGKKQIDLLTEYRAALITAAVTGKIDVRNHAAAKAAEREAAE